MKRLLAILLVAPFMAQADVTIANVATPSIQRELGATGTALELVVGAYIIAFGALLITGARLGQVHGYRNAFALGAGVFSAASLCCGLAPSPAALVAARAVQGAGAALMFPQALTGIQLHFTGAARTRAIGLYSIALSSGAVAGQLLGGVLTAATSWRVVFLVNVPIGVAAAVAALRSLPVRRGAVGRADLPGASLLTVALLAVVLPLVLGRAAGWPAWTWISLAGAVPVIALFVAVERRRPNPLVNLHVIAHPPVRWALVTLMIAVGTYYSLLFALAQHLQHDLGETPTLAGVTAVPWVAAFGVAGRLGRRAPVPGCLLLATGYAGAALAGHGVLLMAALGVGGFGLGLLYSALLGHLTEAVPARHAQEISGLSTTAIQIGGAVCLAGFGTLYLATGSFALTASALGAAALAAAGAARQAVKPRISSAVSSGTSSWGAWPTPSSSTQSAWGSQSRRKRVAADGHGNS